MTKTDAATRRRGDAATIQQPAPIANSGISIWQLVITDMQRREEFGRQKHGTILQINNGRDHLVDAYQEALDLCVYLRQEIEQRLQAQTDAHRGLTRTDPEASSSFSKSERSTNK